jgi:methyl-accepting chemotaxis protein
MAPVFPEEKMADDSRFPLLGRMKIAGKLASVPILFILAMGGILFYTVQTLEDQRSDAVTLDLTARQRPLIERYVHDVFVVSQGFEGNHQYSRQVLSQTLEALIDGGPAVHTLYRDEKVQLSPAPTPELREKLLEQKDQLRQLFAQADEFLKTSPADPLYASRLKGLEQSSEQLYFLANDAVKLFTAHSEGKIDAMIQREVWAGLAVGLLGILFSWYMARSILTPLGYVVTLAQGIAEGNLGQPRLAVASADEVGQLTLVCNRMLDSLKEVTSQTRMATENLNSASAEILASVQQQASATTEQAAAIQQTTATMEEVGQSGSQIAERSRQVASSAEATSRASRSGSQAVQDMARAMESIREQAEAVAGNIVGLSEKTQAVGEIIAAVNDTAEQSNLLALNAAIEAAAAGEQGRRFSVVADEMKHLADQAKSATVQVRSILEEIQKGINTSVMLTEEAVKRVESGKERADVVEGTIRQMDESIQESVGAFQQIVASTNQQQIGFEQVSQAMKNFRQTTEQTVVSTNQLEKAAANINALSQQLRKTVERYRL